MSKIIWEEHFVKGPHLMTIDTIPEVLRGELGIFFNEKKNFYQVQRPTTFEKCEEFNSYLVSKGFQSEIKYTDNGVVKNDTYSDFRMGLKPCPEATLFAKDLIPKYHKSLIGANIGFFVKESESPKPPPGSNKIVLAFAQKTPHLVEYFSRFNFLIFFYRNAWDENDAKFREALTDHELGHCKRFDGCWKTVGHDWEGFASDIQRFDGVLAGAIKSMVNYKPK